MNFITSMKAFLGWKPQKKFWTEEMRRDSNFLVAFNYVLKHEGGWSDHKDDPGGATNYGISLRFLRRQQVINGDLDRDGDIDADDIRLVDLDVAHEIYLKEWWARHKYKHFDLSVGKRIFSFAVNMGSATAHRLAQRACRANGIELVEDGVLGPKSRAAINKIQPKEFVIALRSEAAGHYRVLIERNGDFKSFERGWLRRAYD